MVASDVVPDSCSKYACLRAFVCVCGSGADMSCCAWAGVCMQSVRCWVLVLVRTCMIVVVLSPFIIVVVIVFVGVVIGV